MAKAAPGIPAITAVAPEHLALAVRHLRRADPALARVIDAVGPCTYCDRNRPPFESLVSTIIDQQLSVKAAATIRGRVLALFPGKRFPTPAAVLAASDAALLGAGLSRNKLAAIRDLAAKTIDGTVPTRRAMAKLTDAEILERVTRVKGVGQWTAELLLLHLGRPDVFPVGDLVLRRNAGRALGLPAPPTAEELLVLGEPWRPWRSIASWYLWRAP